MNTQNIESGHTITLDEKFEDYVTFFEESKGPIYRTILKAFSDLKKSEITSVNVYANVEGTEFKSELEYSIDDVEILKDIINPYFEETEEYETCQKVMKLYSELRNN